MAHSFVSYQMYIYIMFSGAERRGVVTPLLNTTVGTVGNFRIRDSLRVCRLSVWVGEDVIWDLLYFPNFHLHAIVQLILYVNILQDSLGKQHYNNVNRT